MEQALEQVLNLLQNLTPLQLVGASVAAYVGVLLWQGFFVYDLIKYRHIPGPTPVPVVGNLHTVGFKHKELLWNAFEDWRTQYGRVFKWFCGQHAIVVMTDPELMRLVCVKHFRVFHDRAMLYAPQPYALKEAHSSGLTFIKGALWASIKSGLQPMVHSDGLNTASRIVNTSFDEALPILTKAAESEKPLELHHLMSGLTLRVIGSAAFGLELDTLTSDPVKRAENSVLVDAAEVALHSSVNTLWTTLIPRALTPIAYPLLRAFPTPRLAKLAWSRSQLYAAAHVLTKNAFTRMGIEHKDEIGMEKVIASQPDSQKVVAMYKDVVPVEGSAIDLLVKARNKETGAALKPHHIMAQANTILVGGHDTTGFTTTAAVFFLATNPEAEKKVIEEVDRYGRNRPVTCADLDNFPYINAVLHETLRLVPPVWLTSREALEDVTVDGIFIPKGSVVYLDLYGMHRDPMQFPEPTKFRPERFFDKEGEEAKARHPYAWSGFGAGPRTCLGYKLGTQEVEQLLVRLYQKFTFELDTTLTKPQADGLPPLQSGIHMQMGGGTYFKVHQRL